MSMRVPGSSFRVSRAAAAAAARLNAARSAAFTLIELITVIGILVLLIALSAPTLTSISQGSNIRTAERQIQAGTYLARQQAVTSRQRIVFCIPTSWASSNAYVRKDMLQRSIILFAESTGGVARPTSVVGKVEVLPPGVVFTNSWTSPNRVWTSYDFLDDNDNVLFRGVGFRYAATGTIYWKDADGSLPYKMILTEGDMKDNSTSPTYRKNPIVSTSEVNRITGKATVK